MAKFTRGIPDSFTLNVAPVTDLGDYLDEPAPSRQAKREPEVAVPAAKRAPAVEAKAMPATRATAEPLAVAAANRVESGTVPPPASAGATFVTPTSANTQEAEPAALPRPVRPKAPRREVSMTAEVMRMSDELLDLIRNGSGQRDTNANELFHALVLLAYEVKDELDPHAIPKRGRWGTPTARAYPRELKNAVLRAVRLRLTSSEAEAHDVTMDGEGNAA